MTCNLPLHDGANCDCGQDGPRACFWCGRTEDETTLCADGDDHLCGWCMAQEMKRELTRDPDAPEHVDEEETEKIGVMCERCRQSFACTRDMEDHVCRKVAA